MEDVKLLIGGRDTQAAKSATFDRLNPISGEVPKLAFQPRTAFTDLPNAILGSRFVERQNVGEGYVHRAEGDQLLRTARADQARPAH